MSEERKRRKRHKSHHGKRSLVRMISGIMLYIVAFAAVMYLGLQLDDEKKDDPVGDLDSRFTVSRVVEYRGKSYGYREHDLENILLIGVDKGEMAQERGQSLRSGGQADFLMLLSVDKVNKVVTPIQIDRDTITEIPIYGVFGDPAGTRETQICLAQAFGGTAEENCENTVRAVSKFLGGIPIDFYMAMDMEGVALLNDLLGGVTVTLEDDFTKSDPAMKKGATLTLQGKQAEIFVRSRMHVGDGSNVSRMARQRVYIDQAMDILFEKMNDDLGFVGSLVDGLEGHLVTNMERGFLINEVFTYSQYAQADIRVIAGNHTVDEDGFVAFYADESALQAMIVYQFYR